MSFWEQLGVASAPIIQVLLISAVGAFMATDHGDNLLSTDFRKSLNKVKELLDFHETLLKWDMVWCSLI